MPLEPLHLILVLEKELLGLVVEGLSSLVTEKIDEFLLIFVSRGRVVLVNQGNRFPYFVGNHETVMAVFLQNRFHLLCEQVFLFLDLDVYFRQDLLLLPGQLHHCVCKERVHPLLPLAALLLQRSAQVLLDEVVLQQIFSIGQLFEVFVDPESQLVEFLVEVAFVLVLVALMISKQPALVADSFEAVVANDGEFHLMYIAELLHLLSANGGLYFLGSLFLLLLGKLLFVS